MAASRWESGSVGAVDIRRVTLSTRTPPTLRAVAFLELLARAAPARVVAPDLLVGIDGPLLHGRRRVGGLELVVRDRRAARVAGNRRRTGRAQAGIDRGRGDRRGA